MGITISLFWTLPHGKFLGFGPLPCDINIQMKLLNLSDLMMLVTGEALWSLIN